MHCGGVRQEFRQRPAGGRAAPSPAGPGGEAPGPPGDRPVHHHRPGGHRSGDRPKRRGGGAAGAVRGPDPGQGEADPGGLGRALGPVPGKVGHGGGGRGDPGLLGAQGEKRRPVAGPVRPVPPRRGRAAEAGGGGGLRGAAGGLHPLGHRVLLPGQGRPGPGAGGAPGRPPGPGPDPAAAPAHGVCLPLRRQPGGARQGGGLPVGGGPGGRAGDRPEQAPLAGGPRA